MMPREKLQLLEREQRAATTMKGPRGKMLMTVMQSNEWNFARRPQKKTFDQYAKNA